MMVRQAHHERFLWVQGNGKALSIPLSFNVSYAVLKSIECYNNSINIFLCVLRVSVVKNI